MAKVDNEQKKKKNNNTVKSDYTERIQKAKEPFKNEILKMDTKEEKMLYLNQQKQKYILLKENSNNVYFISILISFSLIIGFILLFAKIGETAFLTSFMVTLIIIAGIIWIALFVIMKNTNTNYTIILFALDDLHNKIQGSISGGYDEVSKLAETIKSINAEIMETKQEIKEGYSLIEQRLRDIKK